MKNRVTFTLVSILIFSALLIGRAVWIQLVPDQRLDRLAQRQFHSKFLAKPRRGLLLDRNQEPLAVNVETQSLAGNPSVLKHKKDLQKKIAKSLRISQRELSKRMKSDRSFVWLERDLPKAALKRFSELHLLNAAGEMPKGLWLVTETKRVYPHGELAAHVIGDVNRDSVGLEGVELWQEEVLKGKTASITATRDALGRPTFIDTEAAHVIQDGESISLTLDASLQYEVEQIAQRNFEKTKARGMTLAVMDAVTGEILALTNRPTFNPNLDRKSASARRNRAFTDGYEPGSTLKPILLASALMNGWKPQEEIWAGLGKFRIQGKTISEAEADEKFKWLSIMDMVKVSSNVVAAKLALKLGETRFLSTLNALGLGSKTGTGFPGEISGWLPDSSKKIMPLTLANLGFGQGLFVTPIQMLRAYAAIANGGWLVRPSILLEGKKKEVPPVRVFSSKVSQMVTEALVSTTQEDGTGFRARIEGLEIAGKTGTAQVVDPETRAYSRSHYIASFIGFPVNVTPQVVILALVDGPKGYYYGSQVAAPVFKEILLAVANRFSLPIQKEIPVLAQRKKKEIDRVEIVQAHGISKSQLPSVLGMSAREAIQVLQSYPVELELQGFGLVQKQVPSPGTHFKRGDVVRLVFGLDE